MLRRRERKEESSFSSSSFPSFCLIGLYSLFLPALRLLFFCKALLPPLFRCELTSIYCDNMRFRLLTQCTRSRAPLFELSKTFLSFLLPPPPPPFFYLAVLFSFPFLLFRSRHFWTLHFAPSIPPHFLHAPSSPFSNNSFLNFFFPSKQFGAHAVDSLGVGFLHPFLKEKRFVIVIAAAAPLAPLF